MKTRLQKLVISLLIVALVLVMALAAFVPASTAAPPNQAPTPTPSVNDEAMKARADDLRVEGVELTSRGQLLEAQRKLEEALSIYQQIGDHGGLLVSYVGLGTIHKLRNENKQALEYFQVALLIVGEMNREEEAASFEARISKLIGEVYYALGEYQQALDYTERALLIFQQFVDQQGQADSHCNMGVIYYSLGEYQRALEHYNVALEIYRDIDDREGQANYYDETAAIYFNLGDYEKALKYLQNALEMYRGIDNVEGEARAYAGGGGVYYSRGEYQEALKLYWRALLIFVNIGDQALEAASYNNIGLVYRSLGEYAQALMYYEQALKIFQDLNDLRHQAIVHNNMGAIYTGGLPEYRKALSHYQEALRIALELDDPALVASSYNSIGKVFDRMGDYQMALHYYKKAMPIFQHMDHRVGLATLYSNIGETHRQLSEYQEALKYYQDSLQILRDIGGRAEQVILYSNMGLLFEEQGDDQKALLNYLNAIDIIEEIHSRTTVGELTESLAESRIDLYERAILLLLDSENPIDAFNYVERAKARAFLDQLANQHIDVGQHPAVQELRLKIQGLDQRLSAERAKPRDQQSEELLQTLSTELEIARAGYGEIMTILKSQDPEYASLVTVTPLTLEEVQALLDPQTTLVEYFVTSEQTIVFVVTHDSVYTEFMPVARETLTHRIQYFRDHLKPSDHPPDEQETLIELYNWLIAPISPHIRTPIVGIVPHGMLHYLPFAALTDGEHYLIEDYTLFHLPSASVLKYILEKRKECTAPLLAFGNPETDDLPGLYYTGQEAQSVAQLYNTEAYLGSEATENAFKSQAGEYCVIHLAAHGQLDPVNPLFSNIRLAADKLEDGRLEVHEVYGLDLEKADLVTLSACETQLGRLTGGDELVSLQRAFIYAGTPSLIASLWSVDDEATAELMVRFYRHLREGVGKALALRQAQLETVSKYPHPYFWAAFGLVGDYGGLEAASVEAPRGLGESTRIHIYIGTGVLVVFLFGFVVKRVLEGQIA